MAKTPKKTDAKTPSKAPQRANKPTANLLSGGQPLIDTNLAARAAASMFLQKNKQGTIPSSKSSLVDQIKADLNKSASANLGEILGGSTQAASHLTGHKEFSKQTRAAQSNDAARTGVPRRNPG
jgi:hypothetical protein